MIICGILLIIFGLLIGDALRLAAIYNHLLWNNYTSGAAKVFKSTLKIPANWSADTRCLCLVIYAFFINCLLLISFGMQIALY